MVRFIFTSFLLIALCPCTLKAQVTGAPVAGPYDNRYDDLSDRLTIRTFLSRKIIGYQVGIRRKPDEAEYSPNDATSVGIGFAYKFLGLNANFRLPLLNNDNDVYGETKSLDLASYIYLRKFVVDVFAQIYKGHYLSDNDLIASRIRTKPYALRPDLQTQFYGVNGHYVFNHKRFSYRASFLQNEWQRQSAGSFLAGLNIHHIRVKGDSTIIPSELTSGEPSFDKTSVSSVGLDGGYAHTFVWNEHWFATLALMAGIGGHNTQFSMDGTDAIQSTFGLHLNSTIRLAVGYNSEKWFAGLLYVNFLSRNYAEWNGMDLWQQTANGIYRFVLARRLVVSRP